MTSLGPRHRCSSQEHPNRWWGGGGGGRHAKTNLRRAQPKRVLAQGLEPVQAELQPLLEEQEADPELAEGVELVQVLDNA